MKSGGKTGIESIPKLLNDKSYAMLEIVNALAWMGQESKVFTEDLKKLYKDTVENRLRQVICHILKYQMTPKK